MTLFIFSFNSRADIVSESAEFLSSDALKGRSAGTIGNQKAREYLFQKMQEMDLEPVVHSFSKGKNLIGIIRPENKNVSPLPQVIIGAHFDHVNHCKSSRLAKSRTCNGAADNAAAVAAVLGAVEILKKTADQTIAIIFWDAEEKGLLGSRAFASNPTFDLSETKLYINLDIIGLNLFRGMESHSFIIGVESGGQELMDQVDLVSQESSLRYHQLSYGFAHYRSDMTSFVINNRKIPFVFFTDGDGKVYHSSADEFEYLNLDKVRGIATTISKLANRVAVSETGFPYRQPSILLGNRGPGLVIGPFLGLRNGMVLPLHKDVRAIRKLTEELLAIADKNQISAGTRKSLLKNIRTLDSFEKEGPGSFGKMRGMKLMMMTKNLLDMSKKLKFIP